MSFSAIRLGLQQRVLPSYRAPFFDALAERCGGGLSVFAGKPRPDEMIDTSKPLITAQFCPAGNLHLFKGAFYLCWQTGWRRWLAAWQPEALILEANPRYLHVPWMSRWMHRRSRPVIGWGLGAPPAVGALSKWRERSRRSFLAGFDALVTYSRQGAEEYHRMGFPQQRVFVAPNAVAPRPAWKLPERPPVFNGKPVILFVGRLQARKRADLLIRACAALQERFSPELWIVGAGAQQPELEALARQIYPQTRFLGARYGADLAPLFEQADLFVLPGTGGLAVQEAMAYGLPVAVAEADGTQSELVRPENGWMLPPGDLNALITTLAQALSDPSHLRQMGRCSYQIVAGEINLEHMVEVFQSAINFARSLENARTFGC